MRILHVYSGNLYGGVETALATLGRLAPLCPDLDQEFALCYEGRLSEELERTGCKLHLLGSVRASRPLTWGRARAQLRALLRRKKFDVAICHSTWAQALFAPAAHAENICQVFWMHDALSGGSWMERWARLTPPNLAIANSRFTGDTLPAVYPGTPAEVLYFPIDPVRHTGSRDETRRTMGVSKDTIVVVQVSRMEPWKGHKCHLAALDELRGLPGWACWMVGGPQRPSESAYYEEMRAMTSSMGIGDRVRLLGNRSDVPQLLQAADIYCQPNTAPEPFGIAFVEALYCNLPVITSAIGGGKEIVNERCGLLVSPNDPGAVARALETLIVNKELRTRMAQSARIRAQELCDPAVQMGRFNAIVRSVARRRAGSEVS